MAENDLFAGKAAELDSPAGSAFAITPSDATPLFRVTRGIYVGGTGDIECIMADTGATVVFNAVPQGVILPVRVTHVKATNTTATLLRGMY